MRKNRKTLICKKQLQKMKDYQSTMFTPPKIDCDTSFFFIQEKLMKPAEAAKLTNVNYETARKWKAVYKKDPEHNILTTLRN